MAPLKVKVDRKSEVRNSTLSPGLKTPTNPEKKSPRNSKKVNAEDAWTQSAGIIDTNSVSTTTK